LFQSSCRFAVQHFAYARFFGWLAQTNSKADDRGRG
jgi:hypothetical protein